MLKIFVRLICILVILFSSFVLAEGLEGSIPNKNGDYCVIVANPSVLPKGVTKKLELNMWSSTEVFSADVNGQPVTIKDSHDYINDSVYGINPYGGKNVQETTLYTLTVVPKSGNEYSCSTLVNVLDSFSIKPTENSCVLTAIPLYQKNEEGEVSVYFSLSWNKFEDNTYYVYQVSINDGNANNFRREKYIAHKTNSNGTFSTSCSATSKCKFNTVFDTQFSSTNIADFPTIYTAKVYWEKNEKDGKSETYNMVSQCNVTVEGMLPNKLPLTSQPVQPTKLTYNDGLEAGKQLCIDNPTSCGIAISSAINALHTPIVYDAITNILSIPEILIPVITEESQSYEAYEAQLKIVPTQNNDIQLRVSNMAKVNEKVTSSWKDNVNAKDSIELLKTHLAKNNRSEAIKIIDSINSLHDKIKNANDFLNGIGQHSGDSTKQVLYALEFFLRNYNEALAGSLIAEGSIVNAAELIENDAGLNAAAKAGGIRDLKIKVKKDAFLLASTVSDIDVKIHELTYLSFGTAIGGNNEYLLSENNPTYEGKYMSSVYGHSFESGVLGGLYLVEISRNGEILKQQSVFLEPKDKQAITIYL
ncbi:MAG: hypothetical protein KAG43_10790 [Candidatus Marithrix sp.]|nr:hypothetical protein [Candidatus Marithrix sp.]